MSLKTVKKEGAVVMSRAKKKGHEDLEAVHEAILEDGRKRFPLESYQRLRATGASREEALELLGFDPADPGLDASLLET